MNNGNKGIDILLKALSVIIAAAALITAIWWWQMPYMHNLYADEYLNIGVHIFVFLCCAALCVFTFIFAGKNNGLLRIMGIALFVFSVCTFLVNSGFVPPILHIMLLALLYAIVSIAACRPAKEETLSLEELTAKLKISKRITIITAVVAAFSILFPKGRQVGGIDMAVGGVIEYYTEYGAFDYVLYALIPISLIVLVIFIIRTVLLSARVKDAAEVKDSDDTVPGGTDDNG
ncbi:MAG: hypothetical protein K5673_09275 [Lachnospiraceae bacterium]|nr:hypothetical protein [Lachnospiraceae bacterium]